MEVVVIVAEVRGRMKEAVKLLIRMSVGNNTVAVLWYFIVIRREWE
jgi:hypothetical protein